MQRLEDGSTQIPRTSVMPCLAINETGAGAGARADQDKE